MIPGLIVIEIAAANPAPDELAALLSACTKAAMHAECALSRDPAPRPAAAVAIVTVASPDHFRIEVGIRHGEQDVWRTREFAFLAEDEPRERWRSIGFAIGTLYGAEEVTEPAKAPEPPPAPPEPAPAPPPPPVTPPPPARVEVPVATVEAPAETPKAFLPGLFVEASGLVGPGLDTGPWRLGGSLRVLLERLPSPVFVSASLGAATRVQKGQHGTTARWFDVGLGAGYVLLGAPGSSGLELRIDALAERFDISASATDGRSDSDGRWMLGADAAFVSRLSLVEGLLIVAELSGVVNPTPIDIAVGGARAGATPVLRYTGGLGLRVRLR